MRFPGIFGTVAFLGYVIWNVRWIAQSTIPPSILIGVCGVPAPTTGMTRSVRAFVEGNWSHGFLWNPMTIPFCALLLWTLVEIACKLSSRDRLVISKLCAKCWFGGLLVAWIAKFSLGAQWW